tara:strand:+ start:37802 stop:38995 length:1194 start_codon:yes stop_codon:yes gene_type:complete
MALSYFDKAVIFLLPILVLQLFKDQTVYLSIEYIYSVTIVIIPFLDLGLVGYFFYIYRNKEDKRQIVNEVTKIFHIVYFILFALGLGIICVHYYVFSIDDNIIYIVSRAIFLSTFAFLSSYYRLKNKPERGLYVTITANVISLIFLFIYVLLGLEFDLWVIFIGQILFCVLYFFKVARLIILKWRKQYQNTQIKSVLKASILFSWPSIIQVFIMMYIANYGKINALEMMSLNDGTLLSIIQRFSMLVQLTHGALLAFMIKEIYVSGNILEIKTNLLKKYFAALVFSIFCVLCLTIGYFSFNDVHYDLNRLILALTFIIGYTFIWCFTSYLEVYYSRENKNKIKLYLAIINAIFFVGILNISGLGYLEKITAAMFFSTLVTFIISLAVLKQRKYYLSK